MLCGCPRFIPELLFRNAITGFVCKIVSLLFVYRVDVSSVTNICTVLFPKRIVPKRATLIFIKEKSELQRFVLGCEMSFLNKTSFNFPANIYSVLIPGKLNDLFLCFSV